MVMESRIGEIILTNDIAFEIENTKLDYPNNRIFFESNFKIDSARAVIDESYISSNMLKCIVIAGDSFTPQAQNTLLKVLEEPPTNIKFILITKSKNSILPTILSRMIVFNRKIMIQREDFDIDLNTLTLESIRDYIKDLSYSKEETRSKIESLLFSLQKTNIKLNRNELDCFSDAISQCDSGINAKYIFLVLLLMILENKRKTNKWQKFID